MQKKSGFVSIIGAPNAGKSTLLNALVGEDLSIVTSKPQTTRNRIFGILNSPDIQIIFVDTPGILEPRYKLQEFMANEVGESLEGADAVMIIYDVSSDDRNQLKEILDKYGRFLSDRKSILVLNKIDLITKEELLVKIDQISKVSEFSELVPVSAKKNFNIEELRKVIISIIPEGEFYYDEDIITSQPERFFVSEIIRQNVLKLYKQEVPFSVFVMINEFKEREKGKDYINASIIVERESQKRILIGSDGSKIKTLGEKSRKGIEDFLGRDVYLELFVKVSENWKNDERFIKKNIKSAGRPHS